MKKTTLKLWTRASVALGLVLLAGNLFAQPTVTTLGGGMPSKFYGYSDGNTLHQALFHTPSGLALDSSGQYLFVADRDNNQIRELDLNAGMTWTLLVTYTNLINKPIAVAVDDFGYVYVLNHGNGNNGSMYTFNCNEFSSDYGSVITNAVQLTNATGMALDGYNNIYLTVQSNKLIRIAANTSTRTTIATITNAGTSLQGIVIKHNGLIAACDSGRNGIYLINPATGIVTTNAGFHGAGDFITNSTDIASSNTAKFYQPMCVAETGDGTLIVSDYGNNRYKAVLTSGVVSNLCGVTSKYWGGTYPGWYDGAEKVPDSIAPNAQSREPFGVVMASDGSFYVSEDYYHIIRKVTGAGLTPPPPAPPTAPIIASVITNYGQVTLGWYAVSSATNYNVKRSLVSDGPYQTIVSVATTNYTDTNVIDGTIYYYVVSAVNSGGEGQNSAEVNATPLSPPAPEFTTVITNYGLVSLSWSAVGGANYYNLKRSPSSGGPFTIIASTPSTSYNDTNVLNGATYYYVVSTVNAGGESTNSIEIEATPPQPPVPDPQIGYVDFPATSAPVEYTSVFHPISSYQFYNDAPIVIVGTPGSGTYYTIDGSTPTAGSTSIPSDYQDGLSVSGVLPYIITEAAPSITIKAVGTEVNRPNSAVVQATFQFITGNPKIVGNNAAQFTISDITANAHLYYTIDGSDPSATNGVDLGTVATPTNVWTVGFPITTNTLFKVLAVRNNYQSSAIVSNLFNATNFVANIISFGFDTGEASSDFVASPGQLFYAPVTLSILPGTKMYSLQFNLTVTNGGPNPGPAVAYGLYGFQSMLIKPLPNDSTIFEPILPAMFVSQSGMNPDPVTVDGSTNFTSLVFNNPSINLLGVGWLERAGKTNLYNTVSQDLIQFSQAHDTQFEQSGGKIVVGGYAFPVPANATAGQTYQIQIGRPTATADGIGGASSDVYIAAPTNGATAGGDPINAVKYVTVGQRKYIAGSVYPFHWFNAGDFGSSNLVDADVEQVFQSAVYSWNTPPPGSDFFDAMDSCGNLGTLDTDPADINNGNYTNAGEYSATYPYSLTYYVTNYTLQFDTNNAVTNQFVNLQLTNTINITSNVDTYSYLSTNTLWYPNSTNIAYVNNTAHFFNNESMLFSGDDSTIDQVAFGDGVLDVCDVYVTFRRSLDPSLTWYRRFWNGGQRVADTGAANVANHLVTKGTAQSKSLPANSTVPPQVNFTAGDIVGSAGNVVQIPITASIFGSYPLRVLMLNLTVVPLDGSPALTTPVQFSQNATILGAPYSTDSQGNGNYSAVWLNSTNAGLTGTVTIGTLTVAIPAGASANAAYAVHFDHASASPNGLASFPKQVLTGVITLSSRTNSSYGDGIPDLWRLRWFGTVNNLLSVSNACPSGDGVNNWQKFVAGVDPNTANDFPSLNAKTPVPSGATSAIHWPSVSGKQYVILRSTSLFPGTWSAISTNTGTGTDMEFDDNSGGSVKFYRVLILP